MTKGFGSHFNNKARTALKSASGSNAGLSFVAQNRLGDTVEG